MRRPPAEDTAAPADLEQPAAPHAGPRPHARLLRLPEHPDPPPGRRLPVAVDLARSWVFEPDVDGFGGVHFDPWWIWGEPG